MDTRSDDCPPASPVAEVTVGSDESVPFAVLRAVAAVTGAPPTALPPLARTVDPDGLQATVESLGRSGRVVFTYHGHVVVVRASGVVELYEGTEPGRGVRR